MWRMGGGVEVFFLTIPGNILSFCPLQPHNSNSLSLIPCVFFLSARPNSISPFRRSTPPCPSTRSFVMWRMCDEVGVFFLTFGRGSVKPLWRGQEGVKMMKNQVLTTGKRCFLARAFSARTECIYTYKLHVCAKTTLGARKKSGLLWGWEVEVGSLLNFRAGGGSFKIPLEAMSE